jgi:hypothetical protein
MHEMSLAILPSAVQRNDANSWLDNAALTSGNNFGVRHRDRLNCVAWLSQAILVKDLKDQVNAAHDPCDIVE